MLVVLDICPLFLANGHFAIGCVVLPHWAARVVETSGSPVRRPTAVVWRLSQGPLDPQALGSFQILIVMGISKEELVESL